MADREKLIELLSVNTCPNAICNFCEHFKKGSACEKHKKEVIADHLISNGVTVRERGRWVLGNVEPGYLTPGGNRPWICPKCGEVISYRLDKPTENFCPNCGADMRPKGEGEEDA